MSPIYMRVSTKILPLLVLLLFHAVENSFAKDWINTNVTSAWVPFPLGSPQNGPPVAPIKGIPPHARSVLGLIWGQRQGVNLYPVCRDIIRGQAPRSGAGA